MPFCSHFLEDIHRDLGHVDSSAYHSVWLGLFLSQRSKENDSCQTLPPLPEFSEKLFPVSVFYMEMLMSKNLFKTSTLSPMFLQCCYREWLISLFLWNKSECLFKTFHSSLVLRALILVHKKFTEDQLAFYCQS